MLSSFGGLAMENKNVNIEHARMETNRSSDVGVVYDAHVESVRSWSPSVNQAIRYPDGELSLGKHTNPGMGINQDPGSGNVSKDSYGEGRSEEGTISSLPALTPTDSAPGLPDPHISDRTNPSGESRPEPAQDSGLDAGNDLRVAAVNVPMSTDGGLHWPAHLVDAVVDAEVTMCIDTDTNRIAIALSSLQHMEQAAFGKDARKENPEHFAGGWQGLRPGELVSRGRRSTYDITYSAPVDTISPGLTLVRTPEAAAAVAATITNRTGWPFPSPLDRWSRAMIVPLKFKHSDFPQPSEARLAQMPRDIVQLILQFADPVDAACCLMTCRKLFKIAPKVPLVDVSSWEFLRKLYAREPLYGPSEGSQDNLPGHEPGQLTMKECEVCYCILPTDFDLYKNDKPERVSSNPWINGVMRFCLSSRSVCPYCHAMFTRGMMTMGPPVMTSLDVLQSWVG